MLTVIPRGWFSWKFSIADESGMVAVIDFSSWRERGDLTIEGVEYSVRRTRLMESSFVLESHGAVVARAKKAGLFSRALLVDYAGGQYTLRPGSALSRRFILLDGSSPLGSLSPDGLFTRRMLANLPPEMPLPLRVFVIWLTLLSWKRSSDAAATSAAV